MVEYPLEGPKIATNGIATLYVSFPAELYDFRMDIAGKKNERVKCNTVSRFIRRHQFRARDGNQVREGDEEAMPENGFIGHCHITNPACFTLPSPLCPAPRNIFLGGVCYFC